MKKFTFGRIFQAIYIYFMPDLLPWQSPFWGSPNVHDGTDETVISPAVIITGQSFCNFGVLAVMGMDQCN